MPFKWGHFLNPKKRSSAIIRFMHKVKIIILVLLALSLTVAVAPSYARSGCCSHHGGVSGCGCADGSPLSSTCLPYYPECSGGGGTQQDSTQVPQTQTY